MLDVMKNDIYDLEKINLSDLKAVGEKAIALSQLSQQGYNIPSGIVVGSQVLEAILSQENDSIWQRIQKLDLNDYETLKATADQISHHIETQSLDQEWCQQLYQIMTVWETNHIIFRPSLVFPDQSVSVSGLLTSYCSQCDLKAIEFGLKKVWKSLFSASSLFYWQQQGISWNKLGLAVIIQRIESAIASGILEVNPQQWQIKAVRGLGYSLVRGESLPETYKINPHHHTIESHQLGYQTRIYSLDASLQITSPQTEVETEILTSQQLSQLINLAAKLQATVNQNFSCEWTFFPQENSFQLYLTQFSAQVTMFKPSASSSLIVKGLGVARGRVTGKVYLVGKDDDRAFPTGSILVTKSITTDNLPLVKSAGGLVTESGGMTSHGAILARELNIPAVVGAKGAIEALQGETEVTLDGDQGEVLRPSQGEKTRDERKIDVNPPRDSSVLATQLMVNVSQSDRAIALSQLPVDGVGLLRSDLMLLPLLREKPLSTWLSSHREAFSQRLASLIAQFADAFFPRPIFYRSTDWLTLQQQDVSLLGIRGTYSYVKDSDFFSAQTFALRYLQHQGYYNINLILPFVRTVEEVKFCKKLLTEIGLEKSCQMWIMAEVPSVIYLLDEYLKVGIEGIAIGTNDLTQLLLGVDREKGEFGDQYNECHPAVLQALKTLIEKAREGGISCSICGQGVVLYPELVEKLVGWGVTGISVEESGINTVYNLIARSEKRILLEAARNHLNQK
ncbi:putative PEP-binding protein [Dactylococcopsis salina]|uniref:Phosphoenolpyruvate synthase n=1 Tax=Dactylococcopsis salina (strain PCC 8305) TaxID=13035 RepID=K9YVI9_DACS8|nr:putative PEP-binding protein [Dactylococcopsis salina]AFZ50909.1 phosphoenolpyruvate synthase/pyruvate phosphate dikinase [Dactylococcopsis salina PCC 8305]